MYCPKCGCKVHDGEEVCPNCRSTLTETEYCGGFWGLVEQKPHENSALISDTASENNKKDIAEERKASIEIDKSDKNSGIQSVKNTKTARNKENRILKEKENLLMAVLCVGIILLALFSIVQSVRLVSYKSKYEVICTEYERINGKLLNDLGEIRNDIGELKKSNESDSIPSENDYTVDQSYPGYSSDQSYTTEDVDNPWVTYGSSVSESSDVADTIDSLYQGDEGESNYQGTDMTEHWSGE